MSYACGVTTPHWEAVMPSINYEAALNACNPDSRVTPADLDQAIDEISKSVFPDCSEEDISISRENSDGLAAAVCNRLGITLPTRIVIKRLLGRHK